MAKTEKLDLHKQHKNEYITPKNPTLVEIGPVPYLAIEGRGEPGGEEFTAKVGAMYAAAFTIKMTRKFAGLGDYKVCHLEGLWWTDRTGSIWRQPRDQWRWKLFIRVPAFIIADDLKKAKRTLLDKGKGPETQQVKLETIKEGQCVQMLHVGPYSAESETVDAMRRFAEENGLAFHGLHHEIYLSDPRRVPADRLRTILRQPVK